MLSQEIQEAVQRVQHGLEHEHNLILGVDNVHSARESVQQRVDILDFFSKLDNRIHFVPYFVQGVVRTCQIVACSGKLVLDTISAMDFVPVFRIGAVEGLLIIVSCPFPILSLFFEPFYRILVFSEPDSCPYYEIPLNLHRFAYKLGIHLRVRRSGWCLRFTRGGHDSFSFSILT